MCDRSNVGSPTAKPPQATTATLSLNTPHNFVSFLLEKLGEMVEISNRRLNTGGQISHTENILRAQTSMLGANVW